MGFPVIGTKGTVNYLPKFIQTLYSIDDPRRG